MFPFYIQWILLYILYMTSLHNTKLSVARKTDKPFIQLGLSVFFLYRAIHDFIHCRDIGTFQVYECPILVQKSV